MPKLFDLVKVNIATTGTGTVTFGSVFSPEFFTPSEVSAVDGDTVRYVLIDGTDVELGTGVIGGTVTTMTRTVTRSRIGGTAGTSKINLSGTAYLAFTVSKNDIVTSLNSQAGALNLSVVTQVFTSSGTYTPTTGMVYAIIECVGGGGGGGGVAGTSGDIFIAGGGGSGSYSRLVASAATIGASKTVTIGAAGAGGTAGANNGSAGGDTSVGSLCIGKGGGGGRGASVSISNITGGAGGVAGTGGFTPPGSPGEPGFYAIGTTILVGSGMGASSSFGGGAASAAVTDTTATAGVAAGANSGSGGSGANAVNTASTAAGGSGAAGVVVVTEYVIS